MLVRDWSCSECGSGWLEEVGAVKIESGTTDNVYCCECKARTTFEHCIRESDDTDNLSEPSFICNVCHRVLPEVERGQDEVVELAGTKDITDIKTLICCDCENKLNHNHNADMDAQDTKWGENKI